MSEVISIANQKGGVGKTTTAVNLSASLSEKGKKVLLIDLDPQGNATTSLGLSGKIEEYYIYHALIGGKSIRDVIVKTEIKNLDLAPSNLGLVALENEYYGSGKQNREFLLKRALKDIKDDYDYIIIDSPPALGPITINALCASNSVIIPIQCEFFALEGLAQLLNTVTLIRKTLNPQLKIKGFLPTMFTKQNNLATQVLNDLSKHFKNQLFYMKNRKDCIVIPRSVKVAEAPSYGKPIIEYASKSTGSKAYKNLATAIIRG